VGHAKKPDGFEAVAEFLGAILALMDGIRKAKKASAERRQLYLFAKSVLEVDCKN
jgi:hypothetical protein